MTGTKWVLSLILLASPGLWAHDGKSQTQMMSAKDLIEGVVRIVNETSNIFTAETGRGHGSGFIVHIDKDKENGSLLIFTNKHVIRSDNLDATNLTVEFGTRNRKPEVVKGHLKFVSRIHDFAVVEVQLKDLKQAVIRELPVPSPKSEFFEYAAHERDLRLEPVVAVGNPFDGQNITTRGYITGIMFDPGQGPFIQTQTPINPGNSGGPLVSEKTGEVVGINTMIRKGADGVNFSIPIGVLLTEFNLWRQQQQAGLRTTVADPRTLGVMLAPLDEDSIKTMQLHDTVSKALPGYWDQHASLLMIGTVQGNTALQKDDVLLTMNGQVIGGFSYGLRWLSLLSGSEAEMQVLRKGKVVTLKVPVHNLAFDEKRRDLDFVYLSGMFLQQMAESQAVSTRPGLESRVVVNGIIMTSESRFQAGALPPQGSVITAAVFGDKEYKIKSLLDLKKALNENRGEKIVRLRAYRANWAMAGENDVVQVRSMRTGSAFLDGTEDNFLIPMREVVTPMQFSIKQFKEQFNFKLEEANTRDWRDFVDKTRLASVCETRLTPEKAPQPQL